MESHFVAILIVAFVFHNTGIKDITEWSVINVNCQDLSCNQNGIFIDRYSYTLGVSTIWI